MNWLRRIVAATTIAFAGGPLAYAGVISSSSDPALAGASVITFSSDPAGYTASLAESGVTFTSTNHFYVGNFNGLYNATGQALSTQGVSQNILMAFTNPVTAFGFSYGQGYNGATLNVYDSSNNLIRSVSIPSPATAPLGNTGAFWGFSAANIASADLIMPLQSGSSIIYDGVVIDNLTFVGAGQSSGSDVPEPSSLALLLTGLTGLGLVHGRKKT